jgi:hypothetical protein
MGLARKYGETGLMGRHMGRTCQRKVSLLLNMMLPVEAALGHFYKVVQI